MEENKNTSVEEVVTEQVEQPTEEVVAQEPEIPKQASLKTEGESDQAKTYKSGTDKSGTDKSENFKALREAKERIEKERDAMSIRLQEYEKKIQHAAQEENFDVNLGEDDLAEGKHLKKVSAHIKKLESQLKKYQQQSSEIGVEAKLKSQYPDFDNVVCKDNIELLRNAYPEIAQTLNSSTDLYSKAVSAYTMIKKLGIQKEDNFQQQRELAQKNASKPKPLTSMSPQQGESPLSHANAFANGLTDDLKKQLYREMIESAKKS